MKRATLYSLLLLIGASRTASAADDKAADAMIIAKGLELRHAGKPLEAVEMFQEGQRHLPTSRSAGPTRASPNRPSSAGRMPSSTLNSSAREPQATRG